MTGERGTGSGAGFNLLAVASVIFAAVAAASLVGFGTPTLAVFAVSAGHVALHQIERRAQRGKVLAYVALAAGYGIATYALVWSAYYVVVLGMQLTG